ncbi:hypothetical protein D082_29980 [Synechocystis sp. PCC 6714]|nr:hypothetical protein D082_29980 [Synechocystis sp. PCC 6714]
MTKGFCQVRQGYVSQIRWQVKQFYLNFFNGGTMARLNVKYRSSKT